MDRLKTVCQTTKNYKEAVTIINFVAEHTKLLEWDDESAIFKYEGGTLLSNAIDNLCGKISKLTYWDMRPRLFPDVDYFVIDEQKARDNVFKMESRAEAIKSECVYVIQQATSHKDLFNKCLQLCKKYELAILGPFRYFDFVSILGPLK